MQAKVEMYIDYQSLLPGILTLLLTAIGPCIVDAPPPIKKKKLADSLTLSPRAKPAKIKRKY